MPTNAAKRVDRTKKTQAAVIASATPLQRAPVVAMPGRVLAHITFFLPDLATHSLPA